LNLVDLNRIYTRRPSRILVATSEQDEGKQQQRSFHSNRDTQCPDELAQVVRARSRPKLVNAGKAACSSDEMAAQMTEVLEIEGLTQRIPHIWVLQSPTTRADPRDE
jgi:hypothetical protein